MLVIVTVSLSYTITIFFYLILNTYLVFTNMSFIKALIFIRKNKYNQFI